MKKIDWTGLFWGCLFCVLFVGTIQVLSGNGPKLDDNQVILTAACKCPVARMDHTLEDISDLIAIQSGHSTTQSSDAQHGRTSNGSGPPAKSWDHRVV
jgi:hypothetical protein